MVQHSESGLMRYLNRLIAPAGISFLVALWLTSCGSGEDLSQFYLPAEFEPVESVGFVWYRGYNEIIPELIGIISRKEKVTIFINESSGEPAAILKTVANHGGEPGNIRFVKMKVKIDNVWLRDYGPVYLVNGLGEKKLVQFNYFWTDPGFIRDYATSTGIPVIKSSYNSSGGSREVNGKGTMLLCEAHELDVNQPRTRDEIETEMREKLLQKKVIWLKKGLPQDDSFLTGPLYDQIYPKGVNGHVDEFCRFADPNTVLISSVTASEAAGDPLLEEAKKRLDENYEILLQATDQDGKRFNVIRVPIAPVIITDRTKGPEGKLVTSVTSYMNFIITNSSIILPSYLSENRNNQALADKEKKVERIFEQAFPGREIIRVGAETINYFSGGFHCASIQVPRAGN